MCGIVGICARTAPATRGWLTAARDALRHRGPDDAGEWWSSDGAVGFGHRRLSIIDPTPAGYQPMQDMMKELCIVFNGEIYNFAELRTELLSKGHIFHSHCDTEVILLAYREWGTECVLRFNGMFAFALYDSRHRKLFLARDRAGEKPLFYAIDDGAIRFASELKGLMADPALPRRLDPEAVDCYLAMGYVPGERCILKGVKKLPPAHALLFDVNTGQSRNWRYWRLPKIDTDALPAPANPGKLHGDANEAELLDELEVLLEDAVRKQLLAADVPVGMLLSGGVDSSLVTAFAVRTAPRAKTFTIRFPGHGVYDETEHARLIARHFSTEHVELEAAESTVDLLPLLARQFDEPIVDSSMIPTYLVSRLVREQCKVALGGDGGDELFGGYGHYDRLLWMQNRLQRVPRGVRLPVAKAAESFLPVGFRGRNWLRVLQVDLQRDLPLVASYYFDCPTRRQLMGGTGHPWPCVGERIWQQRTPEATDLVQRATRMDFENYLPEDILVKVDRASMLNSLEVRAPFLDYRVIEFAFRKVPSHLKVTAYSRKVLLKKLAARLLPPEFDQHRKQGFGIPLASWLHAPDWRSFFRDVLLGSDAAFFNHRTVSALLDAHGAWRENSERLFALVMFELWRREYRVSL